MSDRATLNKVKSFLKGGTKRSADIDSMHDMEVRNSKRAKSTIDATRINKDYYQSKVVQQDLLQHYENVDWHERSHEADFDDHMERVWKW